MKNRSQTDFRYLIVTMLFVLLSLSVFAQDASDPRLLISKELPEFTRVRILDVTETSSKYRMWGYPGIWIKSVNRQEAKITYNNVCTPYIKAEVIDGTLELKMDQSFLYPGVSTWKPGYGMISAIIIEVPNKVKLESIVNDGRYQFNTSLMNFDCKTLKVSMSNSLNLMNCKVKTLIWNLYAGEPLAAGCTYNLSLKMSEIGTLLIPEDEVPSFNLVESLGSQVKKYEALK